MLKGELPSVCSRCASSISSTPLYVSHNDHAKGYEEQIIESTREDGGTSFIPKTFDLRTDLCNLKCRTCNSHSSSAIRIEEGKKFIPISNPSPSISDKMIEKSTSFYWAGGEPFMSSIHWDMMEKLVALNRTDVDLSYNTNFTFPGTTLQRAAELLSKFSKVRISISLDGVNEIGEYIRSGLNYKNLLSNIETFRSNVPNAHLAFDNTLTSIGLIGLPRLLEEAIRCKVDFYGKYARLSKGHYLNVNVLRPDIFQQFIDESRAVVKDSHIDTDVNGFLDHIVASYRPTPLMNPELIEAVESKRGMVGFYWKVMSGRIILG